MKRSLPKIDIVLFQQGDSSCYREVFAFYSPIIFRYVQSKCPINEDAEELLQECFVQLFLCKSKINRVEDFYPLLFTIAKRLTISFFRKQISVNNTQKEANYYRVFDDNSTEELIHYTELNLLLNTIIDSLPMQQRQVYVMSQKENMTTDAIAIELSLSKNTVKNHLRLASKSVRMSIQKIYHLFL